MGGRAIEAAIRIFSKHMTLEEDLRAAIDAKAKALSESGSFYFHDGPNVSRIIDAKPEQCQCFVQTRACEGLAFTDKFHSSSFEISFAIKMAELQFNTIQQKFGESESKFDLSRGAARIFEKFVVVPTGIEPVFPT